MVTQEELYMLKGRVQTLREKMNDSKEKYKKLETDLKEILKRTDLAGNPNYDAITAINFILFITRFQDYVKEHESLSSAYDRYTSMLEDLIKGKFPEFDFEKK